MKTIIVLIFICLYCLFLWAFMFYAWRKGYKEWRIKREMRPYSITAKIVDKHEMRNTSGNGDLMLKVVTFEASGRQVDYIVNDDVYQVLRVGQIGILNIANKEFQSFIVEVEPDPQEELYGKIVRS